MRLLRTQFRMGNLILTVEMLIPTENKTIKARILLFP